MCGSCIAQYSQVEVLGMSLVGGTVAVRHGARRVRERLGRQAPQTSVERDAEVAAFLLGLGLDPAAHCDLEPTVAAGCAPRATATASTSSGPAA